MEQNLHPTELTTFLKPSFSDIKISRTKLTTTSANAWEVKWSPEFSSYTQKGDERCDSAIRGPTPLSEQIFFNGHSSHIKYKYNHFYYNVVYFPENLHIPQNDMLKITGFVGKTELVHIPQHLWEFVNRTFPKIVTALINFQHSQTPPGHRNSSTLLWDEGTQGTQRRAFLSKLKTHPECHLHPRLSSGGDVFAAPSLPL